MGKKQSASRGGFASTAWRLVYQGLASAVFVIALVVYPLLRLFKPATAAWIIQRLLPQPLSFQPVLWLHAVSLGEAKLALSLLQRLPEAAREQVLLTATTQTGYDFFAARAAPHQLRYLPWDLAWCYRRLFSGWTRPDVVLVETEIWPNLFFSTRKADARLFIVNGRLGPKTLRYRHNALLRRVMTHCTGVAARGKLDVARFAAFGLPAARMCVTGNMKFDLKAPPLAKAGVLHQWLQQPGPLFVFASISTDEAAMLAPAVSFLLHRFPEARVLWAPRHLEDLPQHLTALAADAPRPRGSLTEQTVAEPRLLVLDTFGELASCYRFATLSLIGGSFNRRGGQNFLESLQAGTPALMGPSTENFRHEVAEALAVHAIQIIPRADLVGETLAGLVRDPARLQAMATQGMDFLAKHQGAVDRTLAFLEASLRERPAAILFKDEGTPAP
ncbi:3-deoxy-D-manno-octulosonic acid transferase [Acanthopleuribacter pedis]|uniref:3-deoxy-D-manno-octulosonic acid transferase n=1 Tax=Acanthopleuribacter pedis TaxID=442870 RepID=A0A8J7U1Q0_9BACT|nr:glycosyltransferase N-terminal domain-containing protein [Acanthopleuribacter pedis]MBO1318438.1 hypothetical protein [Acanthopleuribacter pedis]